MKRRIFVRFKDRMEFISAKRFVRKNMHEIAIIVDKINKCANETQLGLIGSWVTSQVESLADKAEEFSKYGDYGYMAAYWIRDMINDVYDKKLKSFKS